MPKWKGALKIVVTQAMDDQDPNRPDLDEPIISFSSDPNGDPTVIQINGSRGQTNYLVTETDFYNQITIRLLP